MEGNGRGDPEGVRRLPLNVIRLSKRHCINKEKRRRDPGKMEKVEDAVVVGRVTTYKPLPLPLCVRALCVMSARVHILARESRQPPVASHIKGGRGKAANA